MEPMTESTEITNASEVALTDRNLTHTYSSDDKTSQGIQNKLSTESLSVFYGSKQALFDIDLNMREKEITSLIGPSGCGKSTFIRCLNRMNDPISGCKVTGRVLSLRRSSRMSYCSSSSTEIVRVNAISMAPLPFSLSRPAYARSSFISARRQANG